MFYVITGFFLFIINLFLPGFANSQSYPGFTLYTASSTRTDLIDFNNYVVKSWNHSRSGGFSVYLLDNGDLIRPALSTGSIINGGAAAGVVQKYSWNGNLIWEYTYSSNSYRSHHDICPMPNGNVLLIAWEVKSADEAIASGLNHYAEIWPDHIIEVQAAGATTGNIVWEWHAWDHLIQDFDSTKKNYGDVSLHPELFDINVASEGAGDWMHCNALHYNQRLDQIIFSSYEFDEIFIIDHSTTSSEAAGHTGGRYGKGGDILYRWGKPANYKAPGIQIFDVAHNAAWIPDSLPNAGNLIVFNNNQILGQSSIVELIPPMDSAGFYSYASGTAYGPEAPIWNFTAKGFYTNIMGGCQRLSNGNTMISESTDGNLFEIDYNGNVVWSFTPGVLISRVLRYGFDYPGLSRIVINVDINLVIQGFYDNQKNVMRMSDTCTVMLRNSQPPYAIADSAKHIVNSNTLSGRFSFGRASAGNYYLAVKHRNSIESWSKIFLNLDIGSKSNFDFTNSASQTFGENTIQVDSAPVRFAIYSGDINNDGIIDAGDLVGIDNDALNFISGYVKTDITGDNIVDAVDAAIADNNAFNFISIAVP